MADRKDRIMIRRRFVYPGAKDGSILAKGEERGTHPRFSKWTRLWWNASKGAFRSGGLSSEDDDDSIGMFSTAMGWGSIASGRFSVALGVANASGQRAVALGGASATGESAVAIGSLANAAGDNSVAIGNLVRAYSANSVALGTNASTEFFTGSFVYGDGGSLVAASASNQFTVRARGGTRFFSNPLMTSGVTLAPGASAWASISDADLKENFRELEGHDVLAKIARMPVREWNYKAQDATIRHVGPTAQDFHEAFGLGEDPLCISTIDADGVALAGVKALALENQALKAELALLRERLERLEANHR
jgi:trimeric autotransporter adhesin